MNNLTGNIKYLLYAILLYLPTLAHMRAELFLLAIGAIIVLERGPILNSFKEFKERPFAWKYVVSVWLVLFILGFSLVNKFAFGDGILCMRDYYSSFYLFPLLILVSKYFGKPEVFKFLIALTILEVLVGCIEYGIGTRALLVDLGDFNQITDRSLWYDSRCYGLSSNSSIFGYKVMLAVLLLEYVKLGKALAWTFRIILLIGVLLSFSRAVVVVLILFWGIRLLYGLYLGWKDRKVFRSPAFQFSTLIILLVMVFNTHVRYQLSRGGHEAETVFGEAQYKEKLAPTTCAELHAIEYKQGEMDPAKQGWGEKLMMRAEGVQTSGRKLIWVNYINFIEDHLMFGKGSNKVMLRSWQDHEGRYKLMHAHNSYLMLLAANGVLIFGLYMLFYLLNFKWRNFLPIICILIYSALNYGIFWGFSYMDVVFIILLTLKFKDSYDYQRED